MPPLRACRLPAAVLLALAAGQPAAAQRRAVPPAPAAADAPVRGPHDPAEVQAFVDGIMAAWLKDKHIAGATVAVVRDGRLLFAKGYGYADVAKQRPVDPEKTLFRIGSVSKLFTWTAVMQLVEQGKLDLDADVNRYLDFTIPATYPRPITLRDILTHSAGFEDDGRELIGVDTTYLGTDGGWLRTHMPKRVRPPGAFTSYSNYATGLAGYIVARVSGMRYDEYIEKHIFVPLGMTQATTRQPLPAALAPDMAKGYRYEQGAFKEKPFEIVNAPPAGSVSASAVAMSRFMLAHLGNGALGDVRILADSTARQMHSKLFSHDPRIQGFLYGFYDQSSHGLRIFGHGGDTQYMHSDLMLMPDEQLGLFISTNSDQGARIAFKPFGDAFLDHYYPERLPRLVPDKDAKAKNAKFAGVYVSNRRNYTTYQKAFGLAGDYTFALADDGALVFSFPLGDLRLVQVDSLLFRDVSTGDRVAFRQDASGRITQAFLSINPTDALDRTDGLDSPKTHQLLLGGALVMCAATLISFVLRAFRRRAGTEPAAAPEIASGRTLLAVVALLQLAFAGVLGVIVSDPEAFIFGQPGPLLKGALALPVIGLVLTLLALRGGIAQWRTGAGTLGARVRHAGAVLVLLAFFWSLNYWNLLGWKL